LGGSFLEAPPQRLSGTRFIAEPAHESGRISPVAEVILESNAMKKLLVALFSLSLTALPALAQETAGRSRVSLLEGIVSTVLYGAIGITLAIVGFKLFDRAIHADIEKEIFENKNMAAAILAGAVVLGVSLIVAMTIHS
jgi:putative membrane protein